MKFEKETFIKASQERVFDFHTLPDAFERLVPPWEDVEIVQRADISEIGSQAIIKQKMFGLPIATWVAEHTAFDPPKMFEDTQVSGPFKRWVHKHFVIVTEGGALLRDEIEFEPPFSFLGAAVAPYLILTKIKKMFDYRHQVTKDWCESE